MRGWAFSGLVAVLLSTAIVSAGAIVAGHMKKEAQTETYNSLTREEYREQLQQELHGE